MANENVQDNLCQMDAQKLMTVDFDEYETSAIGTRDQLLSAGLLTPAHFPGGRRRVAHGTDDRGRFWSLRKVAGGGDRWELVICHSAADSAAIKASRMEAERREAILKALPTGADSAREKLRESLEFLPLAYVVRTASDQFGGVSGYSLSEAALRELRALAARVVMIVSNAEFSFDAEKHAATVANLTQANGVPVRPQAGGAPVRLRAPLRLVAG